MSILKFEYQENIVMICYDVHVYVKKYSPGTFVYSASEPDKPKCSICILLDQFLKRSTKDYLYDMYRFVAIEYFTSPMCTEKLRKCNTTDCNIMMTD